jgi:hypothetical protein
MHDDSKNHAGGKDSVQDVRIESLDLSGSNSTAVAMRVAVAFTSRSKLSIEGLGRLDMGLCYRGLMIGSLTANDVSYLAGPNRLSLDGVMELPRPTDPCISAMDVNGGESQANADGDVLDRLLGGYLGGGGGLNVTVVGLGTSSELLDSE